jgi:hypothetical protein
MSLRIRYLCQLFIFSVLLVACLGPAANVPPTPDQRATAVAGYILSPTEAPTQPPSSIPSSPVPANTTALPIPSAQATEPESTAAAEKPDYSGIWGIGDQKVSKEGRPWYKGQIVTVGWDEIELADNHFDWSALDDEINRVAANGLYIMVLVYTGRQSPEWIYAAGVPRVETNFKGGSSYPYYLSDTNGDGDGDDVGEFRYYFKRMIASTAQHLNQLNNTSSLPSYHKIIAVQGPIGASGDPHPYQTAGASGNQAEDRNASFGEGTQYAISDSAWQTYEKEMFQYYYDQYKATRPNIQILLNIADDKSLYDWGLAQLPGVWLKYNRVGDRYQNNREFNDPQASSGSWMWEPVREFRNGVANRSRSEMDLTDQGWFTEAPVWNMYWTNLWDLHTGMDIHNILASDLQNPAYDEGFAFYSTYAGYKDPRDSIGVWIALRDGLDMADVTRFPESVYGPEKRGKNRQRYLKIVDRFASYGAQQNDVNALNKTSWQALNDIGWRIYPGNYQMWLYQNDPNGTSQGLWRVGPRDQPYGRFARRFDHASGKDRMAFDIDDRFFFDQPLKGAYPVTIRVIYFDQGSGQWAISYDAIDNPDKIAVTVTKTNSGRWKEQTVTISDGYFGNRGPNHTDLALVNLDSEDDTFHMIELTRTTGYRTGYFGDAKR